MANRIFSETSPLDELIGLAIHAGIMTVDPNRKLDPPFEKHIKTVSKLLDTPLQDSALGLPVEKYDGELARMVVRRLAHDWLDKYL